MKKENTIFLGSVGLLAALGILVWSQSRSRSLRPPAARAPVSMPSAPAVSAPVNQDAIARKGATTSEPKFATLGITQQQAVLNEIKEKDFDSILRIWVETGRVHGDLKKQASVAVVFAMAMRERKPPPEIMKQMREFILDSSNSVFERGSLLGVLSYAQTKESVELLLETVSALSDKELKVSAVAAIKTAGSLRGDGKFHEELSSPLERAWRDSKDADLLIAVAMALAEVGASSGVNALLQSALSDHDADRQRAAAARGALAMANLLNPSAVPPLAAVVANNPPGSAASKLATDALVRMGNPAAGSVLLDWARKSDDSIAPLIQRYVVQTRTEEMLKIWASALDAHVGFRSERNRAAVRAGLEIYNKSRI